MEKTESYYFWEISGGRGMCVFNALLIQIRQNKINYGNTKIS